MESLERKERLPAILQRASGSDIESLLEIDKSVAGSPTYSMNNEEDWKAELESGVVYLIKSGGDVAGLISYEEKSPEHIYISSLAVNPKFQGKGLARDALMQILDQHPEVERFDLTVHPDGPALPLYLSLGFREESREENYFGDGEPRLILALVRGRHSNAG